MNKILLISVLILIILYNKYRIETFSVVEKKNDFIKEIDIKYNLLDKSKIKLTPFIINNLTCDNRKKKCIDNGFMFEDNLELCYDNEDIKKKKKCSEHESILNCKLEKSCSYDFANNVCYQFSDKEPSYYSNFSLHNKEVLSRIINSTKKDIKHHCNNDEQCEKETFIKVKEQLFDKI